MRFFRIETVDGVGPYHSGDAVWDDDDYRHPSPSADGLGSDSWFDLGIAPSEVCGFRSMYELHAWFDQYMLGILAEMNCYYVVEYEVPSRYVRVGGHQAVAVQTQLVEMKSADVADFVD